MQEIVWMVANCVSQGGESYMPTDLLGIAEIISNIVDAFVKRSKSSQAVVETGDIQKIRAEATIQELNGVISESQVKILQELAIARRIDTAEEVEIEEFYDTQGKGKAGLSSGDEGFNLGLAGEGRRVTKRIYRFKGYREGTLIETQIDGILNSKNAGSNGT
jgi:hypothetical protein